MTAKLLENLMRTFAARPDVVNELHAFLIVVEEHYSSNLVIGAGFNNQLHPVRWINDKANF